MIVRGSIVPPGDKSITHRALLLGGLGSGTSVIQGALTSFDARSTAGVLRALGVRASPLRAGAVVRIEGQGLRGLRAPGRTLNCGNSGTTARFMLGVLSGFPFSARLTGDASLRRRPMRRVTVPLSQMGATFEEQNGDGLPLVVRGGPLRAIDYRSPTSSAQVKGALIFAALVGRVPITITEPVPSRDHTERMLRSLGVSLTTTGTTVQFQPVEQIAAFDARVPADPSSAAFLVGVATLASGGTLEIREVSLNPGRTGFLRVLERMGARVDQGRTGEILGEPVGTLVAQPARLKSVTVEPAEVPSLIDEVPLLAVLASRAEGESLFAGVEELRVKESNRLELLAENLRAVGVQAEAGPDTLRVAGTDRPPRGRVETAGDHRIAMAFAVLNTVPGAEIRLSESRSVGVSYPGFFQALKRVRARG